jgi:hypothetical protein
MNDQTDTYSVTADELRQFIERAETLAAEKRDIAEQEKELFAEAKGRGYVVAFTIDPTYRGMADGLEQHGGPQHCEA